MQSLKNLQVLYLFHNKIKGLEEIDKLVSKIMNIYIFQTLIFYFYLSYQPQINHIKYLFHFFFQNTLPELIELGLKGNPIYEGRTNVRKHFNILLSYLSLIFILMFILIFYSYFFQEYMKLVILKKLPQLKVVDNETVGPKKKNIKMKKIKK